TKGGKWLRFNDSELCFTALTTPAGISARAETGIRFLATKLLVSEQALFQRFGDRAAAGVNVEFVVDAAQLVVDGVMANTKFFGDLFFDQAFHHQLEDLLFAR